MKVSSALLSAVWVAGLSLVTASSDATPPETPSSVVILTDATHDKYVAAEKLTLVEYYAPWCGHCKSLAPHYEEAATTLSHLKTPIKIAKVDCTVEKEACSAAGVSGYPTLKIYSAGVSSEFSGDRTADSIVSTLKKLALPPLSKVPAADVSTFVESDRVVIFGYVKEGSKEFKALEGVAKTHRQKFTFGYSPEKGSEAFPSIIMYKKFDEGKAVYEGDFTVGDLTTFVETKSVALMDDIGPDNFQMYVSLGLPIGYLFVDETNRDTFGPLVEPLAKKYQGKVSFVYIDSAKYGAYGKNLGLDESWPAFALQVPEKTDKYPFTGASITTESIEAFVGDFLAGKIEPTLRSAPIPTETFGPGDVHVVVGKTFADIVLDPKTDVLLEIYAPWCGHCKKLAPIYEELAKAVKGFPEIVIAKMDGADNDLPSDTPYKVNGYPTLKFYQAGTKTVIDYDSERTLDGFLAFLKQNAVHGKGISDPSSAGSSDEGDDDREEL